jgi:hypothetical protein
MPFTEELRNKIWKFITPIFPYLRGGLLKLRIIRHPGRQKYHLGWLTPGRTVEGLVAHLKPFGFSNHFIAWIDTDEALGLRKRVDFKYQYHLRIFKDGEIRGHYELTPESHPIDHFYDVGTEPRFEDFYAWLGDWIVREKPGIESGKIMSHSAPAALRGEPTKG